jgi:RimJ/RimL family protein N-acetyltransferase
VGVHFDTIQTDRLLMRRWREDDREPYAAMNADPAVRRYFPDFLTREASDAGIDRMEALFDQQGFGLWALEVTATARFIGFTGLNPMPDDVPGAGGMEVGWRLAEDAWHQGYATEAATAAVDVAFNGIGLKEIWSMTSILNEPSQAVMRRIGMTPYANFEHPRVDPGHPLRPHVVFRRQALSKPAGSAAPAACASGRARSGRRSPRRLR